MAWASPDAQYRARDARRAAKPARSAVNTTWSASASRDISLRERLHLFDVRYADPGSKSRFKTRSSRRAQLRHSAHGAGRPTCRIRISRGSAAGAPRPRHAASCFGPALRAASEVARVPGKGGVPPTGRRQRAQRSPAWRISICVLGRDPGEARSDRGGAVPAGARSKSAAVGARGAEACHWFVEAAGWRGCRRCWPASDGRSHRRRPGDLRIAAARFARRERPRALEVNLAAMTQPAHAQLQAARRGAGTGGADRPRSLMRAREPATKPARWPSR